MSGRRPVWLTDSDILCLKVAIFARCELATLDRTRQRFRALFAELNAGPEPWLTVDDNGDTVRMAASGQYIADTRLPEVNRVLYRAVPVASEGG